MNLSTGQSTQQQSSIDNGIDVTMAAVRSAHGLGKGEAKQGRPFSRGAEAAPGVSLSQVVDAVATEVNGLIGRMRQVAEQGAMGCCSATQHNVLQEEFELLQDELEVLVNDAGRGLGPTDSEDQSTSFREIAPATMKIDRAHANVRSMCESEWTLFRLDRAENAVSRLTDEFGTVVDRLDAALATLDDFVQSLPSSSCRGQSAQTIMDVAEKSRLQCMQRGGVDSITHSTEFQRSVFALLQ